MPKNVKPAITPVFHNASMNAAQKAKTWSPTYWGNKLAFKFLTKPERHEFKQREAALEEEAKLKKQQAFQLKTEQELEKAEAAFTVPEE